MVWKVAANILNKKSRIADKGLPSSLGVGRGANNSHLKRKLLPIVTGPRNWPDSL